MSHYQKIIQSVITSNEEEAREVEQMMRDTYGTLDHLSYRDFIHEAKLCYDALQWAKTPAGQAYIQSITNS